MKQDCTHAPPHLTHDWLHKKQQQSPEFLGKDSRIPHKILSEKTPPDWIPVKDPTSSSTQKRCQQAQLAAHGE